MNEWIRRGSLFPALVVVLAGVGRADEKPVPPKPTPQPAPKPVAAEPAAFGAARALERGLKGTKGVARKKAQAKVAGAWAAAAVGCKAQPVLAGRARAHEAAVRTAMGDLDGAVAAWKQALTLAPATEGPKAMLGLGDLARRRKQYKEALTWYGDLVKRYPEGGARRERALVWLGKLHMRATRFKESRLPLQEVTRCTASTARLAQVYDLLVKGWLQQGDLATARRVLEEGRKALEELGKANARKAKAARRAITGMKARARLERAEKAAGRKTPPAPGPKGTEDKGEKKDTGSQGDGKKEKGGEKR